MSSQPSATGTAVMPAAVATPARQPARATWLGVVALSLLALLALLVAVDGTRRNEVFGSDSYLLAKSSRVAEYCLIHGPLTDCGRAGGRREGVGSYPLSQYLIAIPMVSLGASTDSIVSAFVIASGLSVLGMLALIAFPVRRLLGTEWAVVLAAAMVTGPFVLYSILPFGEALAAFLAFAFVVAACCRRPAWIFVLAVLAGITKETAAPFLVVLGLVCARSATDRLLPAARPAFAVVGGALVGVALNAGFNVFRFGTTENIYYDEPWTRVPGNIRRLKIAISDWIAPNVGVVWFWFLAGVIVAGLVVATTVLLVRHARRPLLWLPPLAVVASIAVFTGGLATWYGTFGWVAWGPRLTIPFIPAFLLAGVWAAREPMTTGLQWTIRRPAALAAVTIAVVVLSIPQAGVVWNRAVIAYPLVADASCSAPVPIQTGSPDYIYGCELHQAWRLEPFSLRDAAKGGPGIQQLAELLLALAVVAGAVWLGHRARDAVPGAITTTGRPGV